MKRQDVEQILVGVQAGTKLKLTYKEDCPKDPFYLVGMSNAGIIQFESPLDEATIWAINQSGDWGHPSNRVIVVITTDKFDLEWFVGRTYWPLESLKIITKGGPQK